MSTRSRRGVAAALLSVAALAGLAGCAQGEADAAATTASAASPTPSAALSQEAELAVEGCTSALNKIGLELNYWYNYPEDDGGASLKAQVTAADDACNDAATQVTVDGFYDAAATLTQQIVDRAPIRLAITTGNPESIPAEVMAFYQPTSLPLMQWEDALKVELGIYPASAAS